jgi:hypothetical protein
LEDKPAWDSLVDGEGGSFSLYFDWKYVHEAGGRQFIPLLVETAPSNLIAILPMVRKNHLLYSTLDSGRGGGAQGLLLKRELSDSERSEAITRLFEYVDIHYSRRCSTFRLAEAAAVGKLSEEPTAALVHSGFRFRYDRTTGLPCSYILRLSQPFEETIWKEWPKRQKRYMNEVARSGVVVVQDRELKHAEAFVDLASETIRRQVERPPTRDEFMAQLQVFRGKTKLFVALLDEHPIVTLLCHYTRSTCYLARVGSPQKDMNRANQLCYKAAIEDACNAGLMFADFGYTDTESLAFFKERFRGTRVPVRVYEKRYSTIRTIIEQAPGFVSKAWHDKSYIWSNRRKLWRRIVDI